MRRTSLAKLALKAQDSSTRAPSMRRSLLSLNCHLGVDHALNYCMNLDTKYRKVHLIRGNRGHNDHNSPSLHRNLTPISENNASLFI